MIRTGNASALDTGFARGFLETTQAYLAHDSSRRSQGAKKESASGMTPLPVIERGVGPRQMLHVLGTDSE